MINLRTSVSTLASVLQYLGMYEAAEAINRQALEGREKALPKEHPDKLVLTVPLTLTSKSTELST